MTTIYRVGVAAALLAAGACQSADDAPAPSRAFAADGAALETGIFHPRGAPLAALDVISSARLSPEERVLVATLQGLVAKSSSEQIYVDEGGPSAAWKDDLRATHGITLEDYASWTELLGRFDGLVSGYILYDRAANPRSLTAATSLSGPMQAIAVDARLEATVRSLGITRIAADVRTRDERWVYANHRALFTRQMAAELSPSIDHHLRDYIAMSNAFALYDGNTAWRGSVLDGLDGEAFCFGYGQDEFNMVADASSRGVVMLPTDLAPNLSALSSVRDVSGLTQATHATPTSENVHYVAFLTSDGDNVAYDLWSLRSYFDNPNRGAFSMGFTISPSMVDLAPSVLRWYYANASRGAHKDFFVAGPSGSGYLFPSRMPGADLDAYLRRLGAFLDAADLHIVNILDANAFDRSDLWDRYLAQPSIDALLYTGYGETPHGRIHVAANGKPIIEARDNLWAGLEEEATVIANINARPANPRSADGYSLVFVHVWTKDLGSVRRVVEGLHANVKVVTPEELVALVKANLGGAAPIRDGTYRVVNANSGQVLDVAGASTSDRAGVLQWPDAGGRNQRWTFVHLGGGDYRVTALHSGKALDVAGLSTADGGEVIQWPWTGGENQRWQVAALGDGTYRLINRHSGKVLEVLGASTAPGARVDQWSWGNAMNQKWRLEPM